MILFLLLIYILGLATTVINLSLLKRWWIAVVVAGVVSAIAIASYPFCETIGGVQLRTFLHDQGAIADCALVQIIESFIMLVLTCRVIEFTYSGVPKLRWSNIGLAPSLALLAGNTIVVIILFQTITGKSFLLIAALAALGIFTVLIAGRLLLSLVVRSFDTKIKAKILFCFLQILLAMNLPLLARGIEIMPYPIHYDLVFTGIVASAMTVIALAGFIVHHYVPLLKRGNRLCRFLIKVCT